MGTLIRIGFIALLSLTSAGCRFGNKVESAKDPDTFTGYYGTQPQSLNFCVNLEGTTESTCAASTVNLIPSLVSNIMTHPVAFQVLDLGTGESYLFSPSGNGSALPVYLNPSDLTLSFLGSTQSETLWIDPACTSQLFIEENGELRQNSSENVSGYSTRGRINMSLQVFNSFEGDCTPSLQLIQECYEDVDQCGGSNSADNQALHQNILDMFNPYIQANLISSSDIPNLTSMGYEVQYQ